MDWFFGFDLGDAESAICLLPKEKEGVMASIPIRGADSFITAYARKREGTILVGEGALYAPDVKERKIRFKSRFLMDPSVEGDILAFARGVLQELRDSGILEKEDCCFYIGCPAGWDPKARERYRSLFERAAFPPVKIVSESRAALVSAFQSKHLQVGYDILKRPVLVADIGSSTTDFAYVVGGGESSLATSGEVVLGGGLMDEALLEIALEDSPYRDRILQVFEACPPWRTYCEFAARRLKEKYFSDEAYWKEEPCITHVRIVYDSRLTLAIEMNEEIAARLLEGPLASLNGASFRETFLESLQNTKKSIQKSQGEMPELLFLTGGVANLPAIQPWCEEVYPDAVVIKSAHPELSVAKGLAYCGRLDEDMRAFKKEVEDLKDSTKVEQIVGRHVGELYRDAVDALTVPILREAVLPVIDQWRGGAIKTLEQIDGELEKAITAYLQSQGAREKLVAPVTRWLKPVSYELEEYTVPICVRHNVPYRALSLTTYLSLSDIDIHVNTKNVFAVEEVTFMIDTIITLVMGLLCGGGGIALIANGLPGIIAGAVISIMVLVLGKEKLQGVLLKTNIPVPMRKLFRRGYFESRIDKMADKVKEDFYKSLQKEKNEEITAKLTDDISRQIDECLIRMAEVVEIPLGR